MTRLAWAQRADAIEDGIAHEKRIKRWCCDRKFALIEKGIPDWRGLFETLG